ncbi:glycosyltransferase [Candidatus Gottesmanbacteria bacterium]|nr:glycosyltransferase [Candidatus Gottesmanbacteria bacterium]
MSNLKVALVHDYLKEYGGAERVLEALHDVYPQAPVYTSFVDWGGLGPHAERLKKWNIKTSWMNDIYPVKKLHSPLRFLAPWVWKSFDFKGFDVVISSSGWFMCKGITVPKITTHICYLHHPPRHLYGYATAVEWKKYAIVRAYAAVVNHFLRIYDYESSQKVNYFIVNSKETQRRCEKFYRRESTVIYPPVVLAESVKGKAGSREYYLCVARLARAKHIDLAIKACVKLNKPLKIVGKGRDEGFLKSLVTSQMSHIEFLGEVSDEELEKVYSGAKALIFPSQDEEFGIVSVEAQSRGVPVIGLRSGGIPETLIDGKTGILFDDLTVESLVSAINKLERTKINPQDCIRNAKKFSKERFENEIKDFISKHKK